MTPAIAITPPVWMKATVVDPTYPPLDTYRSNIVRVIKLNPAGNVQFNIDLDISPTRLQQ